MKTWDDRKFCTLVCSDRGVSASRMTCYMYVLGLIGYKLDFRYKITSNGFVSSDLASYLNDLIGEGYLESNSGVLSFTDDLSEEMMKFPLWYYDLDMLTYTLDILRDLTSDELLLLCLTDVIVSDVMKKSNPSELKNQRATIECTLRKLCSAYSDENFDTCIRLISKFKSGKVK